MGNLRTGHIVEAAIWLGFCAFLYAYSFEFDKEIEIYKFGASAWPRAILLLIAVAAIGQLIFNWKKGDGEASSMIGAANDDGAGDAENIADHNSLSWYIHTFVLLAIPFIYMVVPDWIAKSMALDKLGLHTVKLIFAAILVAGYLWLVRTNYVGGILALPILFGAFLQDFGFYALAPVFIVGVMFLMGERRWGKMIIIGLGLYALLLMLFLSLLYVGLPTGYIRPFYDFGTTVVNILQ